MMIDLTCSIGKQFDLSLLLLSTFQNFALLFIDYVNVY